MKTKSCTWFISDLHFAHHNVIAYEGRPFKSVREMDEALIANWNKYIQPHHKVIVCGDLTLNYKYLRDKDIVSRLNGTKILVRGNHDSSHQRMMLLGFDWSCDRMEYTIAGERVLISHYPYRPGLWRQFKILWDHWKRPSRLLKHFQKRPVNRGMFLIHGHTHSKRKVQGRMINVGVDAWNFRPVSIGEIGNLIGQIKENEKR